ncbi:hypothetical protein HU200_052721 [Digitaria exilis]|uniref:DUF1618 domain-containing protein n=1 Tax=Digitaria exilis TaxID=1010633 RepID=A0A835E928_9POAL|nr:hypothetical protein HU200_052721 [Digitaria exilis]
MSTPAAVSSSESCLESSYGEGKEEKLRAGGSRWRSKRREEQAASPVFGVLSGCSLREKKLAGTRVPEFFIEKGDLLRVEKTLQTPDRRRRRPKSTPIQPPRSMATDHVSPIPTAIHGAAGGGEGGWMLLEATPPRPSPRHPTASTSRSPSAPARRRSSPASASTPPTAPPCTGSPSSSFNPKDIGLLRRRPGSTTGGGEYIVAGFILTPYDPRTCTLCLYDSKLADWKVYALSLSRQGQQEYGGKMQTLRHKNHKVVTIGGDAGTMAFVDLWRGMLFCDVLQLKPDAAIDLELEELEETQQSKAIPLLGYVKLPDDLRRMAKRKGDARLYRDIAFVDGNLKCVDLSTRSLWSRQATTSFSGGWSQQYKIASFKEIEDSSNPCPDLLPGYKSMPHRSFSYLFVCQPIVDLQDDARVLQFTVKMHRLHDQASVVAVDMVDKKILGVTPFFSRFAVINFTHRYEERGGGHGSTHEVELSTHPTDTQTLDRSRGSTTTSTAVPGQSRSTTQGFLLYSDRRCPCADLPQRTCHGIN